MTSERTILGVFTHPDQLLAAVRALRSAGIGEIRVFSPTPDHKILHELGGKRSPVRAFTLAGGLAGLALGWGMTIIPLANFHLHVGGKPLVSLPPFGVVAYIFTILFGAIATLVGMFVHMRLPRPQLHAEYDPRFSADHYGIRIRCGAEEAEGIVKLMKANGAMQVTRSRG